jgi:hypothetical protein
MPDLQHIQRLLQSKNRRVQILAGAIALLCYMPTFTTIWENPEMSVAGKVGKACQSAGVFLGAIALVAIKPESLEDRPPPDTPKESNEFSQ